MLPKYLTDKKLKTLAFFAFEIKGAKKEKMFNFFKQPFLRNGAPYGYDFWHVLRDLSEASKKYHFAFFIKI